MSHNIHEFVAEKATNAQIIIQQKNHDGELKKFVNSWLKSKQDELPNPSQQNSISRY